MTTDAGLRERNTKGRRAALVKAAYTLFIQQGYAATTMDEVSAQAGVSRRTAFRYFPTKEDLVFPYREERLARLEALLVARAGEAPFETVRRACLALARDYEEAREQMLAQWRIAESEPSLLGRELQFDRRSEEAIERTFLGAEPSSARARRRARVRAAAVIGVVRATLRDWLEGGATGDLPRLARETFADLERGFGGASD
ncbi:MAG TPA: TetR family transcriptional regulator [Labilithrix sp.]|nr:TetR family transcriptional regulator [Labilithrix sp.]